MCIDQWLLVEWWQLRPDRSATWAVRCSVKFTSTCADIHCPVPGVLFVFPQIQDSPCDLEGDSFPPKVGPQRATLKIWVIYHQDARPVNCSQTVHRMLIFGSTEGFQFVYLPELCSFAVLAVHKHKKVSLSARDLHVMLHGEARGRHVADTSSKYILSIHHNFVSGHWNYIIYVQSYSTLKCRHYKHV